MTSNEVKKRDFGVEIFDQREKIQPELLDGSGRVYISLDRGLLKQMFGQPLLTFWHDRRGATTTAPLLVLCALCQKGVIKEGAGCPLFLAKP